MPKYYTGVGSRKVPDNIFYLFQGIGQRLAEKGYTLRSGAAEGSDKAFEYGCDAARGTKEIYLPWKDFNGSKSNLFLLTDEAKNIAKKYHPAWASLSYPVQKLMARNSYQVLGADLKTPSKFLVCYTPDGEEIGGTSQAIRIAKANNIPIFNFGDSSLTIEEFYKKIV